MKLDKNLYYKYIHLMYGHDTKFSKLFISFLTNVENGFITDEHLFITPYKNVYDDLKQYPNVMLDESGKNLYIRYYKHCHLIISHSSEIFGRILLTPKKVKNKIVYRYWGGLRIAQYEKDSHNIWSNFVHRIKVYLLRKTFADFAAIGVENSTDIIDLSRVLNKNTKYYYLSYASNDYYEIVKKIRQKLDLQQVARYKKNILLGHRGTEENNHIEILKKLDKYDSKKFDVYVPLSYGNVEYIKKVEQYVSKYSKGNIIIIKEFMDFPEYAKFLSRMDIAIFDGYTSYALGNLGIILLFNKTVYLNEKGVIAEALKREGSSYKRIDDIGNISYEKFVEPDNCVRENTSDLCLKPMEDRIMHWKQMFSDFDDYCI